MMGSYMNLDQPGVNFWDNYLAGSGDSSAQELSAVNLQSFVNCNGQGSSDGINVDMLKDDNTQQLFQQDNANFNHTQNVLGGEDASSSNVAFESLSHSPGSSTTNPNNYPNSLAQLNNNINQTQSEITSIKRELGYDSNLLFNTDAFTNNNNNSSQAPNGRSALSASIIEQNTSDEPGLKREKQSVINKRKSQNRAAQRAFRERKEQKLKELEKKLQASEDEKKSILEELEKLKMKNLIISTENQMLLKNSAGKNGSNNNNGKAAVTKTDKASGSAPLTPNSFTEGQDGNLDDSFKLRTEQTFTFPCLEESRSPLLSKLHSNQPNPSSDGSSVHATPLTKEEIAKHYHISQSQTLVYPSSDKPGERLLSTAAVWEYLSRFEELNADCDLDMALIMNTLAGTEKCYGLGPAYTLDNIKNAILSQLK